MSIFLKIKTNILFALEDSWMSAKQYIKPVLKNGGFAIGLLTRISKSMIGHNQT
jgi:hypothetical protein